MKALSRRLEPLLDESVKVLSAFPADFVLIQFTHLVKIYRKKMYTIYRNHSFFIYDVPQQLQGLLCSYVYAMKYQAENTFIFISVTLNVSQFQFHSKDKSNILKIVKLFLYNDMSFKNFPFHFFLSNQTKRNTMTILW